ncbi:MAG: DUF1674 domain-containing protein [Stenotrophobium sp.]
MSSPNHPVPHSPAPVPASDKAVPLADLLKQMQPVPAPVPQNIAEVVEIGGRKDGPEPTRYGDWEKNGRCIDF